ncbi:MAG TPA: hypothetical protein VER83_02910, partial [Candidatus Nanopelagicales bacterium]|nr:hypothetical protein [Candidatus Nanopelagicales bacterium]
MDDDRLARAREGDLDAFIGLARPRAGRLLGLATIAAGDPHAGALAAASAFRLTWRDLRGLHEPADLDVALERALARHLPRRRAWLPATDPAPATADPANLLGLALRDLAPGDRLAL